MDVITTRYILIFGAASVTLVLGLLLLGIRIPEDKSQKRLSVARKYLAISFLILAGISYASYFMQSAAENWNILSTTTLWVASYQAFLFTLTTRTFIQPVAGKKRLVHKEAILITIIGISLVTTSILSSERLFPYVFYPAIGCYLFQLIHYTRLFRGEYKKSLKQLEAYYDEDENDRLLWVKFCFYSALGVGTLALLSLFLNNYFYCVFIILYTAYYTYMVGRFYNYTGDMRFLIPALVDAESRTAIELQPIEEGKKIFLENEQKLKAALEQWVEEKNYCRGDIGVDNIVKTLDTDNNFFRYYFREVMQIDFRTWRARLRIAEAQRLMANNPDITLDQLAKITGFNHRANFHRQFQKIAGETPSDYKKRL